MYAWMEGKLDPLASIRNISVAGTKAVKIIHNGKVLIFKNGQNYNVLGAKVK